MKIKINEAAFAVIILLVVAIPFFSSYHSKKIVEGALQKQKEKELEMKAELEAFLSKYDQQKEDETQLNIYTKKYEASPTDRDAVHEYVYQLVNFGKNEQAYSVISQYFNETPRDVYWNDIDLWIDHLVISMNTKRCSKAIADGWHVIMRTEENSDEHKLAGAVVHYALNEEECIE